MLVELCGAILASSLSLRTATWVNYQRVDAIGILREANEAQ
jgi:hypothetical protein